MISRLRKKRRTTTLKPRTTANAAGAPGTFSGFTFLWLLAGIGWTAACLPSTATAAEQIEAPPMKGFSAQHQALVREVQESNKQLNVVEIAQGRENSLEAIQAQDFVYKVNTKPPSRERLFRVLSGEAYLAQLEAEYRKAGQTGSFFLPAPLDSFNQPNSGVLSALWFQNQATGPEDPVEQRRGLMGVVDGKAQQNVNAEPEAAIINETVGASDMMVNLEIELGSATSTFGVVLRAREPRDWNEAVDQIKVNEFFFVLFSESSVALYYHEPGKEDLLIKSAELSSKRAFQAQATVFGDQFRVFRDNEEVLSAVDTTERQTDNGQYCGMIAGITEGEPTRVDNFRGLRYGGEFATRNFAPSAILYRGANVHYHPLYFEQIALERYGQHFGNLVAPWLSHGLFFADAALLPYSLGKNPPWVCHDDVCLAQPGDIVPFRLYLPVKDPKGMLLQATAMALAWTVIP
jgi:hypothetical protein